MVSVVGKGDMGQAPDIGSIVSPLLSTRTTTPPYIPIRWVLYQRSLRSDNVPY